MHFTSKRLTEYVSLRGGTEKFLFEGLKETNQIFAKLTFGKNRYSFTIKEGAGKFVFAHERLGYTSNNKYINDDEDIATLGNESVLQDYMGLSRVIISRAILVE